MLGELCDVFSTTNEKSVLFYWIFAISYSLQIYFDFSAYSDMAIGLGRMFGFHFLENYVKFNNQDILFMYSTLVINNSYSLK